MAEQTKAVARKADMLPTSLVTLIQGLVPDCTALLPADITTEQFRAALWLELTGRPQLHACQADSMRECIVKAATYGMMPGRDCHFLPFYDKRIKGQKATFVPNYFGVLRSLHRTGMVEQAFAEVVYTNDVYDLDYGRTPPLIHKPPRKNRGVGEGAYGFIQLKGASRPLVHYMDPDDLDRVRKRSPAHEQGPWVSDPNEMKRKTAMKNVAKYAQLTPLIQNLLLEEEAREREDIPDARHRQNIIDLYGDDVRGSTPVADDTLSPGHDEGDDPSSDAPKSQSGNTGHPGAKQTGSPVNDISWKRTVGAHLSTIQAMAAKAKDDPDTLERLDKLLEQMELAVVGTPEMKDTEGFELAAAVLEWVERG